MRFIADENISSQIVRRLRSAGLDVTSVAESARGASDQDIVALASIEQRIVITEDRDFGEMVVRRRLSLRGVVLLELDRLSNAAEADRVADVVLMHLAKLSGNLTVIEPGRTRLRPLASQ
jgi:predicted nuclease of predicted toxin-antitoxin system